MIRIQAVKFIHEAKVPVYGERGGLSNVRVRGGNEAPVEHEMLFDETTGILRITHTTRKNEPPTFVHASNCRWLEAEAEPAETKDYSSMGKEPLPPSPPAPPPAESPKPKGKSSRVVTGEPDDEP